jgi:hypothetical protein
MKAARWAPLTGVVSVALWVVALFVIGGDPGNTDEEIRAWFADSGHRDRQMIGWILIAAAILLFLWFVAVLRGKIAGAEGAVSTTAALAFGAGLVTTTLWFVADCLFSIIAFAIDDDKKHFVLDPNTYRVVNNLGYFVFTTGNIVALVLVAATSVAAVRTRVLPAWLGWIGFIVAAGLVVSFAFIPFLVLLGWIAVVSALLVWKPNGFGVAAPAGMD